MTFRSDDPWRQAHPRRTDWVRVAVFALVAVASALTFWAVVALAIVVLG